MTQSALSSHFQPHAPLRQDAAIITLVGIAHGSSHFGHLLLIPLFPIFMTIFNLSYTDVGLLTTVFFIVSGLGQAVSGFWVDQVGARRVLFVALALFMLASLAAGLAQGYGGLLLAAVLAGLANASFHPVDFTILNQRVSPARLGHAFSMHGLTGSLGWALAPVFLVALATAGFSLGWRSAYVGAFVFYALVFTLLFWQRDKLLTEGHRNPQNESQTEHRLAFLKLPVIWWCFAFFMFSTMSLAVVQNYMPSILHTWFAVDLAMGAKVLSAYMLMNSLGGLVGGFVVARHASQSERVVAVCMLAGVLLLLLVAAQFATATWSMLFIVFTGFAMGIAGPSRDMTIKRATPKGATGRVYGTVYSGLDTGFALAPLIFGVLMDHGWYQATFAGAALALFFGVGAALYVRRFTAPPFAPAATGR